MRFAASIRGLEAACAKNNSSALRWGPHLHRLALPLLLPWRPGWLLRSDTKLFWWYREFSLSLATRHPEPQTLAQTRLVPFRDCSHTPPRLNEIQTPIGDHRCGRGASSLEAPWQSNIMMSARILCYDYLMPAKRHILLQTNYSGPYINP